MVQSSRGGKNGKLNEKIELSALWSKCRLSILRNGNVPCRYFRNVPVGFRIA